MVLRPFCMYHNPITCTVSMLQHTTPFPSPSFFAAFIYLTYTCTQSPQSSLFNPSTSPYSYLLSLTASPFQLLPGFPGPAQPMTMTPVYRSPATSTLPAPECTVSRAPIFALTLFSLLLPRVNYPYTFPTLGPFSL